MYQAVPAGEYGHEDAASVCPFADGNPNEDELGHSLFGESAEYDSSVGYHLANYAGYVAEGRFREAGSSGGFGKWILYELLRLDLVDAVIQIRSSESGDTIFGFDVYTEAADVLGGTRSVYYPIEMSGALDHIRQHPGRYAITAIPCFVKAIRLLCRQEPVFAERIAFCIGLVCGHLKSSRYADMIAWQLGVEPGDLASIDFRRKLPGATAKQKGVEVRSRRSEQTDIEPEIVQNLFGTDYNLGLFQYRACDYCDDVVGETADISVGDAWLPEYIPDGRGTSILITRHPKLQQILESARKEQRIVLEPLTVDQVVASQAGGYRQRRKGLAYRLKVADNEGRWRPTKRVKATFRGLSKRRRAIYAMRVRLAEESHAVFEEAVRRKDFSYFRDRLEKLITEYSGLYRVPLGRRIRRGLQRRWHRLRRLLGWRVDR